MLGMAFKPNVWEEAEELSGNIVLTPGEPAVLRFRTALENDRGETAWSVQFQVAGVSASGDGSTAGGGRVVGLSGRQLEGDASSTCEAVWEEPDTGASVLADCDVWVTCPDGASSCEAVVEYQLLLTSDTSANVEWVVWGYVSGPVGCCSDPDEVDASLEVEALD